MKTLLFLFALIFVFPIHGTACEWQEVYLVDLGSSEFLGKVIGEYFQCMDVKNNHMLFYNRNAPKLVKKISLDDKNFEVMLKKDNANLQVP